MARNKQANYPFLEMGVVLVVSIQKLLYNAYTLKLAAEKSYNV